MGYSEALSQFLGKAPRISEKHHLPPDQHLVPPRIVFDSTFTSCVTVLDYIPCISEKQPRPPDQHSGPNSTPKTGRVKVALVRFHVGWPLLAHSQAASQFLDKTPRISEKPPLPPNQHPDSTTGIRYRS